MIELIMNIVTKGKKLKVNPIHVDIYHTMYLILH